MAVVQSAIKRDFWISCLISYFLYRFVIRVHIMTKIKLPVLDQGMMDFTNYNRLMNLEPHQIEVIGYCAAFLTTIAFLPQAIQSWRTRDLSGVSLGMYSLFTAGVGLWLIYGLIIEKWPLILANALTFALALSILLLKLRHTSKHRK